MTIDPLNSTAAIAGMQFTDEMPMTHLRELLEARTAQVSASSLRLRMGELTPEEVRIAMAAYRIGAADWLMRVISECGSFRTEDGVTPDQMREVLEACVTGISTGCLRGYLGKISPGDVLVAKSAYRLGAADWVARSLTSQRKS